MTQKLFSLLVPMANMTTTDILRQAQIENLFTHRSRIFDSVSSDPVVSTST